MKGQTEDERQAYIDEMARARGYALNYHKVMVNADFEPLTKTNALIDTVSLRQRTLDRRTKELLFITSLTVMRAGKGHIQSHIRAALDLGVTPEEILEAIEITLPEAGAVVFQAGFEAWRQIVGAEGIQPVRQGVRGWRRGQLAARELR